MADSQPEMAYPANSAILVFWRIAPFRRIVPHEEQQAHPAE
jgi:hypothetical protein